MRRHSDTAFFEFMPWHVEEGVEGCPEDRPYGVVNDDSGDVEGCHANQADADSQVEALYADEGEGGSEGGDATAREVPMMAVIAVEGFETGDGRMLEIGGWNEESLRMLPIPAWVQTEQPEFGGHAGAFIGGRWETIERMDDGRRLYATGHLSVADERGQWAEEQIRSQNLRFVSVDVGAADVDYEVRQVDEDGWPLDVLARFTDYELTGATICGAPAIAWAVVWLEGMDPPAEFTAALPDTPDPVTEPEVVESDGPMLLVASGRDERGLAPAEWFQDPDLDELTHLTITAEGRLFGHLAPWGECHIGMPGCVTAPREDDYAHYATGETLAWCDCGEDGEDGDSDHTLRIPTGVLTLGTAHARAGLSANDAAWHYDHTGSATADLAVGPDEHGIWLAGALRPDATEEQVRQLRAADVSGDWRRVGGDLRLVAVLAVNVAGFSIPRQPAAHLVASAGQLVQTSLVAPFGTPARRPGRFRDDPRWLAVQRRLAAQDNEIARLRSIAEPLRPQAAEAIVASIRPA